MRRRSSLFLGAFAVLAGACGGAPLSPAIKGGEAATRAPDRAAPAAASAAPAEAPPEATATSCARLRPGTGPARVSAVRQGSSVALARRGSVTVAYIADEDDGAIHTVNIDDQREIAVTPLAGSPSQVIVLDDGRVAVTLRDRNRVEILEPREREDLPLEARCSAAVAAEPVALATTPDDARLLVTSGWGHALTALDPADLHAVFTADLARDPRAVLVSRDGAKAYVTHMVGGRLSAVNLAEDAPHLVHAIETRIGDRVGSTRERPLPRAGVQGFALAATATRIFVPEVSVDPGELKATATYGGGDDWSPAPEAPFVSVVNAASDVALLNLPGADRQRHRKECLLPRAAVVHGDALLVSCLGIDALVELDARAVDPVHVERRRFRVPVGPTGIAVDDRDRAVVWSQFAHEVSLVDLSARTAPAAPGKPADLVASLRIPVARRDGSWVTEQIARGRELFHTTQDLRISHDGRACASCHPDGREDSLTWSTPDGPRQTIMLAGRITGSAPYGWFGKNPTVRAHVTNSFRRLGGRGLLEAKDKADFDALIAYIGAMKAPTRAGAPEDPARIDLARRGKALFTSPQQGCATCHADGGTDGAAHDVMSGNIDETSLKFDTPSLRYSAGTAPYFHDGRYATLEDLLKASDGKMGHTAGLTRDDFAAISAYLESLTNAPASDAAQAIPARSAEIVAFPEGWTRPATAALGMTSPSKPGSRSLQQLLDSSGPPRITVSPKAIRVADLPRIEVKPAPDFGISIKARPALEEAKEILAFGGGVSVRDRPLGFIEMNYDRAPIYAFAGGGVWASCRGDAQSYDHIEWQTIAAQPEGTLKFERGFAWFERATCKSYAIEHDEVLARDVGDGLAFAFRSVCPTCKDGGEVLHVLSPRIDWDSGAAGQSVVVRGGTESGFAHAEIPLRPGAAGVVLMRFTPDGIKEWRKSGVKTAHEKHALLGVQVSQGADEPEPTAIVYVTDLPPP